MPASLAAVLVLSVSLVMLVRTKTADIAILRTMGASRGAILRIFLLDGLAIGGAGTVYGPLIGAVLLAAISEVTRAWFTIQGLSLVLYGALLVVIIAFLPNGLIDLFKKRGLRSGRP